MKRSTILAIAVLLLLLACATSSKAQNNNERVVCAQVFEITKQKGHRVECRALSSTKDTITIKYGFRKWFWTRSPMKIGSDIVIYSTYNGKYDDWIPSRIVILPRRNNL